MHQRIMHDAPPVPLTENRRSGILELKGQLTEPGVDSLNAATSLHCSSSKTHSHIDYGAQV